MMGWKSLWIELGTELSFFVVLESCVALLWRNNVLLLAIAAVICVVALARWHSRLDICFFLVIAVLGSLAEVLFVKFGGWQYANPTWFGVPVWFPLAFGTTGLIGGRLARTLNSIWDKARPPGGLKG
jgi:uncharacterized membrane protein YoaT (DUF817 family)